MEEKKKISDEVIEKFLKEKKIKLKEAYNNEKTLKELKKNIIVAWENWEKDNSNMHRNRKFVDEMEPKVKDLQIHISEEQGEDQILQLVNDLLKELGIKNVLYYDEDKDFTNYKDFKKLCVGDHIYVPIKIYPFNHHMVITSVFPDKPDRFEIIEYWGENKNWIGCGKGKIGLRKVLWKDVKDTILRAKHTNQDYSPMPKEDIIEQSLAIEQKLDENKNYVPPGFEKYNALIWNCETFAVHFLAGMFSEYLKSIRSHSYHLSQIYKKKFCY